MTRRSRSDRAKRAVKRRRSTATFCLDTFSPASSPKNSSVVSSSAVRICLTCRESEGGGGVSEGGCGRLGGDSARATPAGGGAQRGPLLGLNAASHAQGMHPHRVCEPFGGKSRQRRHGGKPLLRASKRERRAGQTHGYCNVFDARAPVYLQCASTEVAVIGK